MEGPGPFTVAWELWHSGHFLPLAQKIHLWPVLGGGL